MNVTIAKAQPFHVQFLYELYDIPAVHRGSGLHRPIPAPEWRNIVTGLYDGFTHTYLVMMESIKVGHVAFQAWSKEDRRAEVSIAIHPSFQRKGLGLAAVERLMELSTRSVGEGGLGLQLAIANVIEDNVASAKLFEKVGFKQIGLIPGFHRMEGRRLSRIVYAA